MSLLADFCLSRPAENDPKRLVASRPVIVERSFVFQGKVEAATSIEAAATQLITGGHRQVDALFL